MKTARIDSKARRGLFLSALPLTGLLTLAACGGSSGGNGNEPEPGAWTTGDLHVHTVQSDDSRTTQTLDLVLGKAFTTNNLDWMAVTNHLRSSKYDNNANLLAAPVAQIDEVVFSTAMNHFLHIPNAILGRLRDRVLERAPAAAEGSRRVYLSRRGASMRVMVNEAV